MLFLLLHYKVPLLYKAYLDEASQSQILWDILIPDFSVSKNLNSDHILRTPHYPKSPIFKICYIADFTIFVLQKHYNKGNEMQLIYIQELYIYRSSYEIEK